MQGRGRRGMVSRIVTFTPNPALDVGCTVERVEPERKLRGEQPAQHPGGGGINVARAVRFLDGEAIAVYATGGCTGEALGRLLEDESVPRIPVEVGGEVRESWTFLDRSSGRQYRFSTPGPHLSTIDGDRLLDELRRINPAPNLLVGSGSLPPGIQEDLYAAAAELTSARGGRFVLDTSGRPLLRGLDGGDVYLVKPNFRELSEAVGRDLRDETDVEDAAGHLVREGKARAVLVSLGSQGALLATEGGAAWISALTVPIRSRVGAGDSMVAGVVHALSRDEPIGRAARFGVAAGTAAVTTPGTELCRREDVERLFAAMVGEPGAWARDTDGPR